MKRLVITLMAFLLVVGIAFAQTLYTTKGEHFGALTEEDLDLVITLSVQKDVPALRQLIDQGRAFQLKEGLQCYVVESTWTGKVKCRLKGSADVYFWTLKEELK